MSPQTVHSGTPVSCNPSALLASHPRNLVSTTYRPARAQARHHPRNMNRSFASDDGGPCKSGTTTQRVIHSASHLRGRLIRSKSPTSGTSSSLSPGGGACTVHVAPPHDAASADSSTLTSSGMLAAPLLQLPCFPWSEHTHTDHPVNASAVFYLWSPDYSISPQHFIESSGKLHSRGD